MMIMPLTFITMIFTCVQVVLDRKTLKHNKTLAGPAMKSVICYSVIRYLITNLICYIILEEEQEFECLDIFTKHEYNTMVQLEHRYRTHDV